MPSFHTLQRFILYLIRYGSASIHRCGPAINGPTNRLIDQFNDLLKTYTDELLDAANCKPYEEQKKAANEIAEDNAVRKRVALGKIIEGYVDKYDITNMRNYEDKIPYKEKMQLAYEYGPQYRTMVKEVLIHNNVLRRDRIRNSNLTDLFEYHFAKIDDELLNCREFKECLDWILDHFQANRGDIIEFFAWNENIKSKRYPKFNGLVLNGPTNAGKSMLIDCMTAYIKPEPIPRERDNSNFHLDQLPMATGAIFEEPYITPTNVGTWKLLLEGSIIMTDKKHDDKQGIPRIPIYIACASPLDNTTSNRVSEFKYANELNNSTLTKQSTTQTKLSTVRCSVTFILSRRIIFARTTLPRCICSIIRTS